MAQNVHAHCSSTPLLEVAPFYRTFRLAEGSRVMSWHIHETVPWVIISPLVGAPALCYHGRSGLKPLSLAPNLDGAVVCTAKRCHKRQSPPIELANATKSEKGSTKRGVIVQARTASPSTLGAFSLFHSDARCSSKPVRRQYKVFFTKGMMHHKFSEESRRGRTR